MRKVTLEEAELLVSNSKNLHWDGWTLVHTKPSQMAMFRPDGMRIGNNWYIAKRYPIGDNGLYHVPARIIGHGI